MTRQQAETIVDGFLALVERGGKIVTEKKRRVLILQDIYDRETGEMTTMRDRLVQHVLDVAKP